MVTRDWTRIVAAEHAIPIPCNQVVEGILNSAWKGFQEPGDDSPQAAQFSQHEHSRLGPRQQRIVRRPRIYNDVHGIEISRVCPVACQQLPRKFPLQRRKAKLLLPIMAQNKLDHPVAQPANTVVQENRIPHSTTVPQFASLPGLPGR